MVRARALLKARDSSRECAPRAVSALSHAVFVIVNTALWSKAAELINKRERENFVLFNDALNTFYLGLYGVRHMVKDHSDSEKGNPLPPHGLATLID